MTKHLQKQIKQIDEGKLMIAISKGIRLAAYDFMHDTKKEIDAWAVGFMRWLLHRIFALTITGISIWIVKLILHGRWQKLADWIINNLGN